MAQTHSLTKTKDVGYEQSAYAIVAIVVALVFVAALVTYALSLVKGPPSDNQIKSMSALMGAGFGASATIIVALLAHDHNRRQETRLRVDSAVETIQWLPEKGGARTAGCLAAMVALKQHVVAMRVLEAALSERNSDRKVDNGSATWLIDRVICESEDKVAIDEAAAILYKHAASLTDPTEPGFLYFPVECLSRWRSTLPRSAKVMLLLSLGKTLVSREPCWWTQLPPPWLTRGLCQCMIDKTEEEDVRGCAAVLLTTLDKCFHSAVKTQLGSETPKRARLEARILAKSKSGVPADFQAMSDAIVSWTKQAEREAVV